MNQKEVNTLLESSVRKPEGQGVVRSGDLLSELDEYERRGGKILFWSCPKECGGMVEWHEEGGRYIATCKVCGMKSSDNEKVQV
jgi:hypothetical protein